jgi:hypothetical protein
VRQPVERLPLRPGAGMRNPFATVAGPGRITRTEIRYLQAGVGESCSNARASRNSSNSLTSSVVGSGYPR